MRRIGQPPSARRPAGGAVGPRLGRTGRLRARGARRTLASALENRRALSGNVPSSPPVRGGEGPLYLRCPGRRGAARRRVSARRPPRYAWRRAPRAPPPRPRLRASPGGRPRLARGLRVADVLAQDAPDRRQPPSTRGCGVQAPRPSVLPTTAATSDRVRQGPRASRAGRGLWAIADALVAERPTGSWPSPSARPDLHAAAARSRHGWRGASGILAGFRPAENGGASWRCRREATPMAGARLCWMRSPETTAPSPYPRACSIRATASWASAPR